MPLAVQVVIRFSGRQGRPRPRTGQSASVAPPASVTRLEPPAGLRRPLMAESPIGVVVGPIWFVRNPLGLSLLVLLHPSDSDVGVSQI